MYVKGIRSNTTSYEDMLYNLKQSQKYLLNKIKNYEVYINNFTTLDYEKINEHKKLLTSEDIVFKIKSTNEEEIVYKIKFITDINNLILTNISINKVDNEYNKLQKRTNNFVIYKFIIANFNKLISEEILKGETFNLGFKLGNIRIQKKSRYKGHLEEREKEYLSTHESIYKPHVYKVINWGESNKLKKKIIERGGIPYKAIRDENGVKTGDNGGEQWMIYFTTDYSYWWKWDKFVKHNTTVIRNMKKFSFLPNKGVNSNRAKLQTLLKENPNAALNFAM